jgi:hypothetical protein
MDRSATGGKSANNMLSSKVSALLLSLRTNNLQTRNRQLLSRLLHSLSFCSGRQIFRPSLALPTPPSVTNVPQQNGLLRSEQRQAVWITNCCSTTWVAATIHRPETRTIDVSNVCGHGKSRQDVSVAGRTVRFDG